MQFSLYAKLHSNLSILTVMTSKSARVSDFSPRVIFAVTRQRIRDLTVALIDKTSNGFNLCRNKNFWPSTLMLYSRGSQPGVHAFPWGTFAYLQGAFIVHLQQIKFET